LDRNSLKREIFEQQDWRCWVDGCPRPAVHLHEALVTRGDVQGWAPELRQAIFHEYNCIGLCQFHHNTKYEPKAAEVFERKCEEHGRQQVVGWLESLEFVKRPGRVQEILNGVKNGMGDEKREKDQYH